MLIRLVNYIAPIIVILIIVAAKSHNNFRASQYKYPTVKKAIDYWEVDLKTKLGVLKIDKSNFEIYIRVFKTEQQMEVWARSKNSETYKLVGNYKFCNTVGYIGPKRKLGDRQIPEGFYKISRFKPITEHHLSLKINYPNASDSILGEKYNYGGEIYVHGGCHTIGCIPIGNENIEQVYVWSVMARNVGQKEIPIHVFPNRMNKANFKQIIEASKNKEQIKFWKNIRPGYSFFEENGYLPTIDVNAMGDYIYI